MKKLAIVTPTYNTSKYIDEFLTSLLSQSFNDFDAYIVDDGSSDNTLQIIKKYSDDERVKVFEKVNGGVSSARNYALDKISKSNKNYKYIYFCDSDDIIEEDCLKKVISACENTDADYGLFSVSYLYKNEKNVRMGKIKSIKLINNEDIVKQFFRYGRMWQKESFSEGFLNNKIFRFSLIKNNRFDENLKRSEDFDFFLRVSSSLHKGIIIPDAWYSYRKRNSSLTNTISETGDLEVCLKNIDFIDRQEVYLRRCMQHKLIRAIYTSYGVAVNCQNEERKKQLLNTWNDYRVKVFPYISDFKMMFILSLPCCMSSKFFNIRSIFSIKTKNTNYFE